MELGIVLDDRTTSFVDLTFTRRGMEARLSTGRTWSVEDLKEVIATMEAPRWVRRVAEYEAEQRELAEAMADTSGKIVRHSSGMTPVQLKGAKWFMGLAGASIDQIAGKLINPSVIEVSFVDWLNSYAGQHGEAIRSVFQSKPSLNACVLSNKSAAIRRVLIDALNGGIADGMAAVPICGARRCSSPLHVMVLSEADALRFTDEDWVNVTATDVAKMVMLTGPLPKGKYNKLDRCRRGHPYEDGSRTCKVCGRARVIAKRRGVSVEEALTMDLGPMDRTAGSHCKYGHELIEENVYRTRAGSSACKPCQRVRQLMYDHGVDYETARRMRENRDADRLVRSELRTPSLVG